MPFDVLRPSLAAALALLAAAGAAQAGFTDWSYAWGGSPFAVPANGGTRQGAVNLILPGDSAAAAPVAPVALRAFTSLSNGADRYDDAAYSLTFTVSDPDSRQSHTLTLKGAFDGTVTSNWTSLSNAFTGGTGTQSFDFLGHDFTVTFGFKGANAPTQTWAGDITASVAPSGFEFASASVAAPAAAPSAAPAAAPEPAALTLAGLGLSFAGLMMARRRRPPAAVAGTRPEGLS